MILIADSGSTKTQWFLLDNFKPLFETETIGFNPVNLSADEIINEMQTCLFPLLDKRVGEVKSIYFYGAGCSSAEMQEKMIAIFEKNFVSASEISVMSDLWACIHASCGKNSGISCILGTGSNACVYDGKEIINRLPSLGFILGDEGSGNHIGRQLLQSFFYGEMPEILSEIFRNRYQLNEDDFVKVLYSQNRPNRFLASFAPFASEYRDEPFIRNLLEYCFDTFFRLQICKLQPEDENLPLYFVGSIASVFEKEIREVASRYNFTVVSIIKSPFPSLLNYYIS